MNASNKINRKIFLSANILSKRIQSFYFAVFILFGFLIPVTTISIARNDRALASSIYGDFVITAKATPNAYRNIDYMTSGRYALNARAEYISGGIRIYELPEIPNVWKLHDALHKLDCIDSILVRTSAFDETKVRLTFLRASVAADCFAWDFEDAPKFFSDRKAYTVPSSMNKKGVLLSLPLYQLVCSENRQIGKTLEIGEAISFSYHFDGMTTLQADIPFCGIIEGMVPNANTSFDSGNPETLIAVFDTETFASFFTIPVTNSVKNIKISDIDFDKPFDMPESKTASANPNSILIKLKTGANPIKAQAEIQKTIDENLTETETAKALLINSIDFAATGKKGILDENFDCVVLYGLIAMVMFFQIINYIILKMQCIQMSDKLHLIFLLGCRRKSMLGEAQRWAGRQFLLPTLLGLTLGLSASLLAINKVVHMPIAFGLSALQSTLLVIISYSIKSIAIAISFSSFDFLKTTGGKR